MMSPTLADAVGFYEKSDYHRAEEVALSLYRIDPNDAAAHQLLGAIAHRFNRTDRAIEWLELAASKRPSDAAIHYNLGTALQIAGRLNEAVASLTRATELAPASAEARGNLGYALHCLGRSEEALQQLDHALRLKPDFAGAHNNRGLALLALNRADEARQSFERALSFKPDYAEAHFNLANLFAAEGKIDEALPHYERVVQLRPENANDRRNLALALGQSKKRAEAIVQYREALRRDDTLSEVHNNLGILLKEEGQPEEALKHFERALELLPEFVEALINQAGVLGEQKRFAEAEAALRRAAAIKPDYALTWNVLGLILHKAGKRTEAMTAFQKAIELDPSFIHPLNNLGLMYWKKGNYQESLDTLDEAIRLNPTYVDAHLNRSEVWLQLGDFKRGWAEYEWRLKHPILGKTQPDGYTPWDGSPLAGKTILLRAEQGLGDTMQFVRYAPLLKRMGARVILECQKALAEFLKGCPGIGVDQLVPRGDPFPPADCFALLMSLPHLLGTTIDTIPKEIPYLRADPRRIAHWQKELPSTGEFRIGIVWQGNPKFSDDAFRSIPLKQFLGLARLDGVRLYALQKGFGREQLADAGDAVVDLGGKLDLDGNEFRDTSAVMHLLDLIISIDSSCVHLAGALGLPVWIPTYYVSDWRWLIGRDDSPWYPTVRLFRQPRVGDWEAVFAAMSEQIRVAVEKCRVDARNFAAEIGL